VEALEHVCYVEVGEVFADREMLTKTTHSRTIRARGHVELLALSSSDLIEVLRSFPDVYHEVFQYTMMKYNYAI